jgi:hypothetical protein
MITDHTFNTFARALADGLRHRAKGLDGESARIVNTRPGEHILAGFLTPRAANTHVVPATADDDDAQDLPRDSAFELTSVGLEWRGDEDALSQLETLSLSLALNVYVRCTPTLEEQRQFGSWRKERTGDGTEGRRVQSLIPVWRRLSIAPFDVSVSVGELLQNRRQRLDVSAQLRLTPEELAAPDIFSVRQAVIVTPEECETETAFTVAARRASAQPFVPFWKAIIDVRLIRVPTEPSAVRVAMRVINDSPVPGRAQGDFLDANLYAIRLTAQIPVAVHRPTIFQELPASFRYDREMAGVGINSHVEAEVIEQEIRLTAESVPLAETPRLEAREFSDADPTFAALASNPVPILESVSRHMDDYDSKEWADKVLSLSGLERAEAETSRVDFSKEMTRFKRGVELLKDPAYPFVLQAFQLMNQAMQIANKQHLRWRLFQIAFIVSLLPELASREYPQLRDDSDGKVELLWFAAGGGKTEAFMGIILWQAFFDRLRGKRFGNTAFVRFPLRLLTFQQLQRLARALAAAEIIRKQNGLKGARFSIGYFVGSTVTPNSINDELHQRYVRHGIDARYQRIFKCPFCDADAAVGYEPSLRLIEHRCTNPKCGASLERLPVYVTDQDIYRFVPTVIVSTVDKLALFGQNYRFSNIFGRIDLICNKHGASFNKSNDLCEAAAALGRGEHPPTCEGAPVQYGPFHDPAPAVLVQDELHLLNEELGTFDAHYETGIIALFRSLKAKPWKIIGATATIQDFERQAWELYLKGARQVPASFPPMDQTPTIRSTTGRA